MASSIITKICTRSGLSFETTNGRLRVHPAIADWTTCKDTERRYTAIAVIERGKSEGWDTLEKFEEEIAIAFNPPAEPEPDWEISTTDATKPDAYNKVRKGFLARITGTDPKFGYKREFVAEIKQSDRTRYFKIEQDGIYQACSYSAKGNKHSTWYKVIDGDRSEITEDRVAEIFSKPQAKAELPEGAIAVKTGSKFLGEVGEVVTHDSLQFVIVKCDHEDWWEDIDGVSGKYPERPYEDVQSSWSEYTFYLRPATEEEKATKLAEEQQGEVKKEASKKLQNLVTGEFVVKPQSADYPNGDKIVLRRGHYQDNEVLIVDVENSRLWRLIYNGRDGDLWDLNNVASSYIGAYLPLTPELATELEEICTILEI